MSARLESFVTNNGDIVGPVIVADVLGGNEVNGGGSLTIEGAKGTQDVIVEVSPGTDSANADIWIQVALTVPTAGVEASATKLTGAASAQYGRFEMVGIAKVRARCTATGNGTKSLVILHIKGN